nr:MAG TPA: tail fiber assembly protein [Caudoviricetes sp.]
MNSLPKIKPVCQLDAAGFYLCQTVADADPMQPENWLIPAGCVETEPPEVKHEQAAKWQPESKKWAYLPDYRGKTAYRTDNGQPETVETVGELPAHLTLTAPPSELHQWNGEAWALSKEAAAAVKAKQQAEMWERIKAKRAQSCHAGIYINSIKKWMHSDLDSRQQYTFLRTLDKLPENLMWKTVDNSFVPMTRALLDELSLKLIADEQHDFQNAERHKVAMLKAENPLDYDYSDGWSAADLMNKETQHG